MANVVWNDHELWELLKSPHGAVARDLTRRAIRVHSHAVSLCPVDTGNLRSSLTWKIEAGGDSEEGISAIVGTNVEYAGFVEEGTSRMKAQPYLRPSLRYAS